MPYGLESSTWPRNAFRRFYMGLKHGYSQGWGLGACTIISKQAIQSSVNFNEIFNSSYPFGLALC